MATFTPDLSRNSNPAAPPFGIFTDYDPFEVTASGAKRVLADTVGPAAYAYWRLDKEMRINQGLTVTLWDGTAPDLLIRAATDFSNYVEASYGAGAWTLASSTGVTASLVIAAPTLQVDRLTLRGEDYRIELAINGAVILAITDTELFNGFVGAGGGNDYADLVVTGVKVGVPALPDLTTHPFVLDPTKFTATIKG